jgi:drug/metabolite transporter (DMT)-like permease
VYKVNTFHAIVINYTVCVITGTVFTRGWNLIPETDISFPWVQVALFTGLMFLSTFFLMSQTVIKVSVTVAGIANKTALVIPVCASLLLFPSQDKAFTGINYLGMALALAAIVLSSWKNESKNKAPGDKKMLLLPVIVFLGGGLVDTIINYANYKWSGNNAFALFPVIAFASAACTGWFIIAIRKEFSSLNLKAVAGGLMLGVPNYFSIYYLLEALKAFNNDGALVFPVVNTGIIILTTLLATILFRERLSLVNLSGLIMAILAIVFIFL